MADGSMLAPAPGTTTVPGTGANTDTDTYAHGHPHQDTLFTSALPRPRARDIEEGLARQRAATLAAHRGARGEPGEYWRWLEHIGPAAGCARPVQLRGRIHEIDTATGEVVTTRTTDGLPDHVVYKACGNRRASACPSCAETYRADTYQLILAGINGGKGIPDTVQLHPCVFPTFTSPSFGPVHSTRAKRTRAPGRPNGGPGGKATIVHRICRPGRRPRICPHGVDLRCFHTHTDGERILGTPLCPDCYDHDHQVVWNAFSGELWRRTMQTFKDTLATWAKRHDTTLRPSYAKVAEMQARGVAHFHGLVRLDGHDPEDPTAVIAPHPHADHRVLRAALTHAVKTTSFRSPPHPDNPNGWVIAWGRQLDIREVRLTVHGEITETAVAGYLAKYATKSTETTGHLSTRITSETIADFADLDTHTGRLVAACWRLGRPDCDELNSQANTNSGRLSYTRVRRWAHMLGFGGHFSTKSRHYSTTLKTLRHARLAWRRQHHRTLEHTDEETTLIVGHFSYAATGWRTTGDALLANSAAAKARWYRQIGKEQAAEIDTYLSQVVDEPLAVSV